MLAAPPRFQLRHIPTDQLLATPYDSAVAAIVFAEEHLRAMAPNLWPEAVPAIDAAIVYECSLALLAHPAGDRTDARVECPGCLAPVYPDERAAHVHRCRHLCAEALDALAAAALLTPLPPGAAVS